MIKNLRDDVSEVVWKNKTCLCLGNYDVRSAPNSINPIHLHNFVLSKGIALKICIEIHYNSLLVLKYLRFNLI